jgi:hypothetical protein
MCCAIAELSNFQYYAPHTHCGIYVLIVGRGWYGSRQGIAEERTISVEATADS